MPKLSQKPGFLAEAEARSRGLEKPGFLVKSSVGCLNYHRNPVSHANRGSGRAFAWAKSKNPAII
ncbi:hypothetical protein BCD67_22345 [Oscillatoriales cyanobacterium USR001]|nr:hypothetical protein BCD67_22345 [Oscillatoriales cyanobacterium USR001]